MISENLPSADSFDPSEPIDFSLETSEVVELGPKNPKSLSELAESLGAEWVVVATAVDDENITGIKGQAGAVNGIDAYAVRFLLACDAKSVFLVPDRYYAKALELANHYAETGRSTFDPANLVSVNILENEGFTDAVERQQATLLKEIKTRTVGDDGDMSEVMYLPFIQTEQTKRIEVAWGSADYQNPEVVEMMNNKRDFAAFLVRHNIPTPDTIGHYNLFARIVAGDVKNNKGEPWHEVMMKINRGASGCGVLPAYITPETVDLYYRVFNKEVSSFEEAMYALAEIDIVEGHEYFKILHSSFKDLFQVEDVNTGAKVVDRMKYVSERGDGICLQAMVENLVESPGVVFWIGNTLDESYILGSSGQILANGKVHMGNEGPLAAWAESEQMRTIIQNVIKAMFDEGVRGPAGVDLLISLREADFEGLDIPYDEKHLIQVGQANLRITGQTRAVLFAAMSKLERWYSTNTEYMHENYEELSEILALFEKLGIEDDTLSVTIVNHALVGIENKLMMILGLTKAPDEDGMIEMFDDRFTPDEIFDGVRECISSCLRVHRLNKEMPKLMAA